MTEDYLSKVLESAYSNTICEWQAQGISDKEIIDKINQKTDGSIDMLLEQASKDYYRSKISRNYWLFEPKCRNNAEITYTQRLQIASYFP